MAVIREARRSTENIKSSYNVQEMNVSFPWVMMFLCILVDVIDIILYLTIGGGVVWWFVTMIIFTPILTLYMNSREKKFSIKGVQSTSENTDKLKSARDASRAAKKTGEVAKGTANVAKTTSKAKYLKWSSGIFENIPFLELAPIYTIVLFMAYLDNKNSAKAAKKSMLEQVKNPRVNISKSVTRIQRTSPSK